jgi:DNA-binding CsgD family transcriptional regulator
MQAQAMGDRFKGGDMRSMLFKPELAEFLSQRAKNLDSLAATSTSDSEVLSNLYDVVGAPQNWVRFLRQITPLLRGSVAAVATYQSGETRDRLYALHMQETEDLASYGERQNDSSFNGSSSKRTVGDPPHTVLPPGVLQLLTTASAPSVMTVPIDHPCLLRDLGCSQALIGLSSQLDGMISYLVIGRRAEPAFSMIDEIELQPFLPHVARSLHLYLLIEKLSDGVNDAVSVLDRLPIGIAFFNNQATCLSMNKSARQSTNEARPLFRHMQTYVLAKAKSMAPADRNRSLPQVVDLPHWPDDQHHLLVTMDINADGRDDMHTVFFIINTDQKVQIDAHALSRLFHLTAAEARIATLIANGARLDDVAVELDISLNTVRTHLRHIFEKTGVERQADLIHLLLRALVAIRAPHS